MPPGYWFMLPPGEFASALADARSKLGAEGALRLLRQALTPILLRRDLMLPLLNDDTARTLLLATGAATLLRGESRESDFTGKGRQENGGSMPLPSLPPRLPHGPDAPTGLSSSSGGAPPPLLLGAFAILLAAVGLIRPRRGWVVRSVTTRYYSLAVVSPTERPG